MTPGHRIYYKLWRLGASTGPWENLDQEIRDAYESAALSAPELVPTEEEIAERDAEMSIQIP